MLNKRYQLCMFATDARTVITFGEPFTLHSRDWKAAAHTIQELIITNDEPHEVWEMGILPIETIEAMRKMRNVDVTHDADIIEVGA